MAVKNHKKRIVLLDAHAIIHRAYHALPDFVSSTGEPTGALYGVCTMLLRIGAELRPDYVISCYDLPKPTFRHVAYENYKAGRQKAEDGLVVQLQTSRDIFDAFDIPIYEKSGFEADDILGTIVEQLRDDTEVEIIIASGDMDTMQLIEGNKVQVYTLKKGIHDTILYNQKAVEERFGFAPNQIPDYKGLAGDTSDNIIGIKGIGTKTATNIISTYGSIENLYKNIQKDNFGFQGMTPRIKQLLVDGQEDALFSKTLATIRRDAPIVFTYPKIPWIETLSEEKVLAVITRFEFKSLTGRVTQLKGVYAGTVSPSLYTKTSSSKKTTTEENTEVLTRIEMKQLQVLCWLLNADKTNPKREDILEVAQTTTLNEAKKVLESRVMADTVLAQLYTHMEQPLLEAVERMYQVGVSLDTAYLQKLEISFTKTLETETKTIYKLAGKEFNINSPKQLSEVLFGDLKLELKGIKKTSTGARSTNIETLEKLKDAHEIVPHIMVYRELEKMQNTYIMSLPKMVHEDNKVHSDFIQTGAATGRFSSENPNMQNIPVVLEEGKNIRRAFVAGTGKIFLAFDYSQIDLRCAAILSNDSQLQAIFLHNKDAHTSVAAEVFGVKEEAVTPEMRRAAKVINFGIVYGMGVSALKDGLGGSREEAQTFYDAYKNSFRELMNYLEQVKISAKNKGYTETLYGRRRPMPLLRSALPFLRAQGERMAINAPIQGTTADIMRFALVDVYTALRQNGYTDKAELVLQIHDELILEVDESLVHEVSALVIGCMEGVLEKYASLEIMTSAHVPLRVNIKKGYTLGDLS
ncbi:MAG: polymerase polymerase protein [Candidatus Parcubacteria bacterium]|jgi:DNA polymerase-1